MDAKKANNKNLRFASIGAALVLGSALAFVVGARVGANLDHRSHSVTAARVPVPTVQVANNK